MQSFSIVSAEMGVDVVESDVRVRNAGDGRIQGLVLVSAGSDKLWLIILSSADVSRDVAVRFSDIFEEI